MIVKFLRGGREGGCEGRKNARGGEGGYEGRKNVRGEREGVRGGRM